MSDTEHKIRDLCTQLMAASDQDTATRVGNEKRLSTRYCEAIKQLMLTNRPFHREDASAEWRGCEKNHPPRLSPKRVHVGKKELPKSMTLLVSLVKLNIFNHFKL